MKLVAYIRTSTARQSLGLEAQSEIINRAAKWGGHEIAATFSEQESGHDDNRAEFLKAIAACKAQGALLCVAKIDRMSRNETFSFAVRDELEAIGLQVFEAESGRVLTPFEFGLKVVFAADERRKISQRTREALAALKASGVKLGAPNATFSEDQRAAALEARRKASRENECNRRAYYFASLAKGLPLKYIAIKLNEGGFTTAKGGQWNGNQVRRLLDMFEG